MTMQARIHDALVEGLAPSMLDVINESHLHNVPPGAQTHFKVVIVSTRFEGMPALARHREVHRILEGPLREGVHALSVHPFTPAQWTTRGETLPESPPCMGGSKK